VTRAFLDRLLEYDWPGNIRELENTIRSAIALCKTNYLTTHELKDLGSYALGAPGAGRSGALASALAPMVKESLERKEKDLYEKIHAEVDRHVLEYVLSRTRENQSEAARLLGISRLTLRKKLGMS
jgi:two-component system nitrogen regulation response regulator GlnG